MVFCSVTMVNFTQQSNVIGYLLEISSIEKFNAIRKNWSTQEVGKSLVHENVDECTMGLVI